MNRTCVVTLACVPFAALALWLGVRPATAATPPSDKIDFNRDIRPIISENCYYCHGPDHNHRKADLRLDTKGGLFDEIDKIHPVVPGKVAASELYRRITVSRDDDDLMPPTKSNKKLTAEQIAKFKKWIEQGAPWEGHWAYTMPKPREIPTVSEATKNPIDNFILDKLHQQGIKPGKQADKITLCRRVYFDLLGLPPTPQETAAFLNDTRPDAYERLVDQLLASPHFGERMAVWWLDQVRYADTIGYHSDNPMNVWPYRDWVIEAFNQNMPFDEFTVEQLAGDLLPNATTSQKVASCYNRLLLTTGEGGAQPKEYIAKYAADRVRNFSTVWLAQTMACCECHDHKFDPITTREFYNMESFFADIQEAAIAIREPGMPVPTAADTAKLNHYDAEIAAAKAKLNVETPELAAAQVKWEQLVKKDVAWKTITLLPRTAKEEGRLRSLPDGSLLSVTPGQSKGEDYIIRTSAAGKGITAFRLEALADPSLPAGGPGNAGNGNFVLTHIAITVAHGDDKPQDLKIARASADFSQDAFPISSAIDPAKKKDRNSGWAILPQTGKSHEAILELSKPIDLSANDKVVFTLNFRSQYPLHSIGKLRLSATTDPQPARTAMPKAVHDALAIAPEKRTAAQREEIAAHFRSVAPQLQSTRDGLAKLEANRAAFENSLPKCLVSTSGPRRTVRVLARGNWMDDSGAICQPGTPAVLNKLKVADPSKPATRLDLAHWVVSPQNPLTARVFVNRLWQTFYGSGIARKTDDFGSQGDWPTHPELLDWLALKYEHGWDTKAMIKLMVTSRTYRETSVPTAEQLEKDPANLFFSHQARFRLDAEFVRDNALAISGLLADKLGGRPAFPYQPAGYWSFLNFPPREWKDDKGEGLYRRGLYTHWQRTFLQPSLLAFDAPSREEAVCERTRSNVPQQALALLNDTTYVEASRVFAEHILQNGSAVSDRLEYAFRQALSRPPKPLETEVLTKLLAKHLQEYSSDETAAKKLISIGDAPAPKDVKPAELAAWTNVARAILNLHETITRN